MVCEAFNCTPAEAERQDWRLVQSILDYRMAQTAISVFNGPDKAAAFGTLQRNPHLLQVLAWMNRAQQGRPLESGDGSNDAAEGFAVARERRETPDTAEEDNGV